MDTLLQVGLSNAVIATALALVAGTVSLLWRQRPALIHGLWLLVLLKLLTPPLVHVPILGPTAQVERPQVVEVFYLGDQPSQVADDAASSSFPEQQAASLPLPSSAAALDWLSALLLALWATGSISWFLLAGIRLTCFVRLLRHAMPAPASVQDEVNRLAVELGMRWCPAVQLLPGQLAPMLWAGLGAPRLLLPADLVGQLDVAHLRTLMAHELAHLRRRDHYIRLIEFFALGLYWWHPVVWFARRALREAEEQCCDAWVVSILPGDGKTYATALLTTLDFLSTVVPVMPPLASGIGQVSDLKRRLKMIMHGSTPRALSWLEGLAVLSLATLLPLLPTRSLAEIKGASQLVPESEKDVYVYKGVYESTVYQEVHESALPLKTYIVEPPDILSIDASNTISLPVQQLQQLTGDHLVRPDGTIYLGIYGSVYVTGLTVEQIRDAIATVLKSHRLQKIDKDGKPASGELTIEQIKRGLQVAVQSCNSKVYYIVIKDDDNDDQGTVYRMPTTGNETVLDALAQINGLASLSKKKIWGTRITPEHAEVILPVDWCGIVKNGSAATNYQILPGDRIYVTDSHIHRHVPLTGPVLATPSVPQSSNADDRFNQLEKKLDAVLRELESLRKEKKADGMQR